MRSESHLTIRRGAPPVQQLKPLTPLIFELLIRCERYFFQFSLQASMEAQFSSSMELSLDF